jgi:hypothetical protein
MPDGPLWLANTIFNLHLYLDWITAAITEHEGLTQRKSKTPDRVLRVHGFVSWPLSFYR